MDGWLIEIEFELCDATMLELVAVPKRGKINTLAEAKIIAIASVWQKYPDSILHEVVEPCQACVIANII